MPVDIREALGLEIKQEKQLSRRRCWTLHAGLLMFHPSSSS